MEKKSSEFKEQFTEKIEKLIKITSGHLSDDVMNRLKEMEKNEDSPAQIAIYESYFKNLKMADEQNKPCCQDTGLIQFYIKAGTFFPYLDIIEDGLTEAVKRATKSVPLRPNAVNYFEDRVTEDNTGERCPWIHWELVPGSCEIEITVYFSGAGCSLPGQALVFKPSDGMDAVISLVFDIVTGPGINACPPLLVGIGLGHNIENAALLSKKALLRPFKTYHHNPKGSDLEKRIFTALNSMGMGAQGLRGKQAVMGVHIESGAHHIATIACAVNISCYVMRRGIIRISDNNGFVYNLLSHNGVSL